MGSKYSPEKKAEVRQLRTKFPNATLAEIAKLAAVSPSTASTWTRDMRKLRRAIEKPEPVEPQRPTEAPQSLDNPKIGDVVFLKSGGPRMTIADATPGVKAGDVVCVWFNEGIGGMRQTARFPLATLQKADQ